MITPDGEGIALAGREGPGLPLLAVHATGFCKELWEPVLDLLPPRPVVAPDQRGHGDSSVPPTPFDWWDLGRDLLAVVRACGLERPAGMGHSSGATALVLAELLCPGTFASLLLVEPIVFPVPPARLEDNPMTRAALRRRRAFASPQEAAATLRGRGAFRGWTERALALYVAHGFRAEGERWTLKCTPEVEGEFYRGATAHGAWERLHEISCPVVLAAGAESTSHPASLMAAMSDRFGGARLEVVPDAGHFLPMERPEALAALAASLAGGEGEAAPGSIAASC